MPGKGAKDEVKRAEEPPARSRAPEGSLDFSVKLSVGEAQWSSLFEVEMKSESVFEEEYKII